MHRRLRVAAALAASIAALTIGADGEAQTDKRVTTAVTPDAYLWTTTEGAGKIRIDPPGAGRRDRTCTDPISERDAPAVACRHGYQSGARVTVRAIVDNTVRGARFVGWSDYRCPRNRLSCTLTMHGARYLTAIFAPRYLKVVEGTFGAIRFTPPSAPCTFVPDPSENARTCKVPYAPGALVRLERHPDAELGGGWRGPCQPFAITCTVRMHMNTRVVAGLRPVAYQMSPGTVGEAIRLEYAGPRGGTIVIRPVTGAGLTKPCRRTCTALFRHGELVEIRARSGRGARFRRWADSNVRSSVRRVRIGLRNPVRAIFARR